MRALLATLGALAAFTAAGFAAGEVLPQEPALAALSGTASLGLFVLVALVGGVRNRPTVGDVLSGRVQRRAPRARRR